MRQWERFSKDIQICENNPKQTARHRFSEWQSKHNYEWNVSMGLDACNQKKLNGKQVLVHQYSNCFRKLKFGSVRQDKVNCEIMATYNALVLVDKNPDFFELVYEFEQNALAFPIITALLMHRGMWGSNPLKAYGCEFSEVREVSQLDDAIRDAACAIISYRYGKCKVRIHTYAVIFSKTEQFYFLMNASSAETEVRVERGTIERLLSKKRLMTAYLLRK